MIVTHLPQLVITQPVPALPTLSTNPPFAGNVQFAAKLSYHAAFGGRFNGLRHL